MERKAEGGNLEWIIAKVAETLKVAPADLRTASPRTEHKDAWKMAAYAAIHLSDRNFVEIGMALGGASHSKVQYARSQVEARMAADPVFRLAMSKLLEELAVPLL